ncbi:hypothetical protein H7X64_02730 [Armatimonadetes bacterium]|nr:hypothetical protein [bacterium]MDP9210827.1 hypothetical protein [Thermoproteota archaeon]
MTAKRAMRSIIFLILLSSIVILFAPVETIATSNLKQIPSEATDFPGNNQEAVEIQVTVAKKDTIGDYHMKGETTLQFVRVTGHFLNDNNQTVGVTSCCYTEPTDIESGHTGTFDSFVGKEDLSETPNSFRLSFDWN